MLCGAPAPAAGATASLSAGPGSEYHGVVARCQERPDRVGGMRSDILTSRLGRSLLTGAVAGLGGLVPIGRAPQPVRIAWVAVPAALPLVALVVGSREGSSEPSSPGSRPERPSASAPVADDASTADPLPPDAPEEARTPRRPTMTLGYVLGMSGLMGGLQWSSLLVDRALERFLRRRGVTRPRVVIGAASAVLMAAVTWAEEGADEAETPRTA